MSFSILLPHKCEIDLLDSRFIGLAYRIIDEEEAKKKIAEIKEEYPDATHHCFAYRVNGKEGASDDGEPSHTAGLPLLNLLRKQEMDETLVVVVRYFGGTKLGAGRLMRTYLSTGQSVLEGSSKGEIVRGKRIEVALDYSSFERLKRVAEKMGASPQDVHFEEKVRFFLEGDDKIIQALTEMVDPSSLIDSHEIEFIRRIG